MRLGDILLFSLIAVLVRFIPSIRWRNWGVLFLSLIAIYWLQPITPIRYLDFWLPSLTVFITTLCWYLIAPPEARLSRVNLTTFGVIACFILLISISRYISLPEIITSTINNRWLITASRPPQSFQALLFLISTSLFTLVFLGLQKRTRITVSVTIFLLVVLLLILKQPELSRWFSVLLRILSGQSTKLADPLDIRWIGLSYVVFRLIHTLRDYQTERLPPSSLQEYLVYVIFFPSYTAGPIDRLERFLKDLREASTNNDTASDFGLAGNRLVIGLFKKFAIADTLSLFSLSPQNAPQIQSPLWMWIVLYAYSLQIYFDFSGYTDIAIGLARILGFRLPENFRSPYLKPSLTHFWNNWHITLTQWFRSYYFNPLTRWLRSSKRKIPATMIIFITQVTTMLLIGLWHGVTWNFFLWGLWHGLGLFIQNRYSEWSSPKLAFLENKLPLRMLAKISRVTLTFHYVTLGWVWFVLPSPSISWTVIGTLTGLR